MKLYATRFTQRLDFEIFQSLLSCLDKNRRERILRYRNWEDSHRAVLADCLVRSIIFEETGLRNEDMVFTTNDFHKPELANYDDFYFNLSHSGNFIICAIDQSPIGVDIEKIEDIDMLVSEICLSPEEREHLEDLKKPERLPFFYTLWTLKESYIKALGTGMSEPLNSFSVRFLDNQNIRMAKNKNLQDRMFLKIYDVDNGYKMAVCAPHNNFPLSIISKDLSDLLSFKH